jgi:hypothetical protein
MSSQSVIVLWIQCLRDCNVISDHRKIADDFRHDNADKKVLTATKSRCGQTRALAVVAAAGWDRASGSEIRTERPGHGAYTGGTRDRTASRMERHHRLQPHVQKLLGPVEIPHCEESADGGSKCWPNYVVDRQEVTCVSIKPSLRSVKITTGSMQETMLRSGAGIATLVQSVVAPDQGIGKNCIGITSGAPFGRIAINVAGPFLRRDQGNR